VVEPAFLLPSGAPAPALERVAYSERVTYRKTDARCMRCGHLAGLHAVQPGGDASCGLAECDCHEFCRPGTVGPGDRSRLDGVDRHDDDDLAEPLPTAMVVHALELENLTGLASLKLSAFARTVGERTTLVLKVGVLS
jgi:hypothetical protein